MSRRLLKTKAGHGLYHDVDEYGDTLTWEPLPSGHRALDQDPVIPPVNKPVDVPLYGRPPTRAERRSAAIDARLKALGITPRRRSKVEADIVVRKREPKVQEVLGDGRTIHRQVGSVLRVR